MNALRRAIGRKEVILGLLLFLLAGGWFGWHLLIRPASAQVAARAGLLAPLKDLLDAGRFSEAVTLADTLLAAHPTSPGLLKYKAIAQLLGAEAKAALQTATDALSDGAAGEEGAALLAVKALALTDYEHQQPAAAKVDALAALRQAGGDQDAALLARLACAAALRGELDPPALPSNLLQQATQIRQMLEPLYSSGAAEPSSVWQSRFWRRGLALLADSGFLATDAGDAGGESRALEILRRSCPADVWDCYFSIPAKALATVRAGTLDDHARVALLTAGGFLYLQGCDRVHCDVMYRRAIQVYGRLLEEYNSWEGEFKQIVTPKKVIKFVGSQGFHDYRNRMERLIKYSSDWWGIRVVRGEVDLPTAVAMCNHKLWRAMIRVRADRQTNPVKIMFDEDIRHVDQITVADWFQTRSYAPQADWEQARAALLKTVGEQEYAAFLASVQAHSLMGQQKFEEAVAALAEPLKTEPAIADTRVSLRCSMANILLQIDRPDDALGLLDAAWAAMEQGDEYVGHYADYHKGSIQSFRTAALMMKEDLQGAMTLAEQIAGDETVKPPLRHVALARLTYMQIQQHNPAAAKATYDRLAAMPGVRPSTLNHVAGYLSEEPAQTAMGRGEQDNDVTRR